MPSFVYVITNTVNGKRYVGKSIDPDGRWWQHRRAAKIRPGTCLVAHAIRKYGEECFIFEVLARFETDDEACAEEIRLIAEWKTQDRLLGYNLTSGGDGRAGIPCSELTKKKMSDAQIGKTLSEEHCRHLSDGAKRKIITKEHRDKITASLKKRVVSDETKKKISDTKKRKRLEKLSVESLTEEAK